MIQQISGKLCHFALFIFHETGITMTVSSETIILPEFF